MASYSRKPVILTWWALLTPITTTTPTTPTQHRVSSSRRTDQSGAQVVALHEAAKKAVWLSEIVTDMTGSADHRPILISEDNAACLALVNGKRTPARTRHLTRRISYIRDLIETNLIQV